MKTELILVGKTVNKHFVALIDDYVGRINHYMPFSITTIPELKNTKALSIERQGDDKRGDGDMDGETTTYRAPTGVRDRWRVWIFSGSI